MAYFLGRDVKVAMTTEHEAFGIKYASSALDITGTSTTALADTDAIPPRPNGLKVAGTSGVAEVSTLTVVNANENDFESTSTNANSWLILYDPDGDSYAIDFEVTGGNAYQQSATVAAADNSLTVTLTTSTGGAGDIATAISNAINNDGTFSKVFTATVSGAVVTVTNAQTGDATDIVRGSAMSGVINVNADASNTQGVDASNIINDIIGVELTFGSVDEDITFFGQRSNLKAEIKKDINLTITRKKGAGKSGQSHELFSELFNEARCGIKHSSNTIDAEVGETDGNLSFDNNLQQPFFTSDGSNFGYRLHLQMASSKEVLSIKNACMTEYATTINSDGVTEESITFYANVNPSIGTTPDTAISTAAGF